MADYCVSCANTLDIENDDITCSSCTENTTDEIKRLESELEEVRGYLVKTEKMCEEADDKITDLENANEEMQEKLLEIEQ